MLACWPFLQRKLGDQVQRLQLQLDSESSGGQVSSGLFDTQRRAPPKPLVSFQKPGKQVRFQESELAKTTIRIRDLEAALSSERTKTKAATDILESEVHTTYRSMFSVC